MTETPSDPFWGWVDTQLSPQKKCKYYAVDTSGMRGVFTTRPAFHSASKKWIPSAGGSRINIGLMDVTHTFDGAKTLVIRPGFEEEAEEQKAQAENAFGGRDQIMGAMPTDPKEKGPDADGHAVEANSAEALAQANAQAMGEGRQLDADVTAGPSPQPGGATIKPNPRIKELVDVVVGQVAKTKAKKIAKDIEELYKLLEA